MFAASHRTFATGLTAAALIALPGVSQAVDYYGEAGVGFDAQRGFTTTPASYELDLFGSRAFAMTNSASGGSAFALANTDTIIAGAVASVSYTFRIVGAAEQDIPVRVQASGYAQGLGNYQAFATFDLTRSYSSTLPEVRAAASAFNFPVNTGRAEFSFDQVVSLRSNVDLYVELLALASPRATPGVPATAEAFVDPVFTIDPAYASQYSIVGVPGVVPEPGTWLLMLVGLAAVGRSARRLRA